MLTESELESEIEFNNMLIINLASPIILPLSILSSVTICFYFDDCHITINRIVEIVFYCVDFIFQTLTDNLDTRITDIHQVLDIVSQMTSTCNGCSNSLALSVLQCRLIVLVITAWFVRLKQRLCAQSYMRLVSCSDDGSLSCFISTVGSICSSMTFGNSQIFWLGIQDRTRWAWWSVEWPYLLASVGRSSISDGLHCSKNLF